MNYISHGQLIETGIEIALCLPFIIHFKYKGNKEHVFILQTNTPWYGIGTDHSHWNIHLENPVILASIYDLRIV